jgi:hypothetical protein
VWSTCTNMSVYAHNTAACHCDYIHSLCFSLFRTVHVTCRYSCDIVENTIQILQVTKKENHMNTLESFYIVTELVVKCGFFKITRWIYSLRLITCNYSSWFQFRCSVNRRCCNSSLERTIPLFLSLSRTTSLVSTAVSGQLQLASSDACVWSLSC